MHKPVLVKESVEALHIKNQAWYIDATAGAGGHSIEILKSGGKVLCIDQDESMLAVAKANIERELKACPVPISDRNYILIHDNFVNIDSIAAKNGLTTVAGILFDLGISSLHYDQLARGFSFADDKAMLDMRLDPQIQQIRALDLLNALRKDQLIALFSAIMQEHESRKLAKRIIEKRSVKPIVTVEDFISLFPQRYDKTHPATKAFLALRIAVNSELDNIKIVLPKALDLLQSRGRLVVITFHSTEDRLVKHTFSEFMKSGKATLIGKKPIRPSSEELMINPRARSAKLRVIEKI